MDAGRDPNEVSHFRDLTGFNSVGFTPGDDLLFGAADVVPPFKEGTTGTAEQDGVAVDLIAVPTTVSPRQVVGGVPRDTGLTGAWTLTFRNGPDELAVTTPAPGDVGPATDLAMIGGGITPTFT